MNCGGDAPGADPSAFEGANKATIHYLPGTVGWGPTFAGRPTAPWKRSEPVILGFRPRLGPSPTGFGLVISWATNIPVVIDASADLANPAWVPISTNRLTDGWIQFTDPHWQQHAARFYRVRGQ